MGYYKQLHIDCEIGYCKAGDEDTCYKQPNSPSYIIEE